MKPLTHGRHAGAGRTALSTAIAKHSVHRPTEAELRMHGFNPGLVLPEFEHVNRYYDPLIHEIVVKIMPGEYYVTSQKEVVATVLGSCVSACIRDPGNGIGGMNHFMLPAPSGNDSGAWQAVAGRAARYGSDAMEHLINAILKAGGQRKNLEVKIFGGGKVLAQVTDVGQRNIAFVRNYIATESLRLVAEDVGGETPRHVQYFPATGKVRVKHLRVQHNETILVRERDYRKQLEEAPLHGEVELF